MENSLRVKRMDQLAEESTEIPAQDHDLDPVWNGEILTLNGTRLHLEARLTGRARTGIVVTHGQQRLVVDEVNIGNADARTKAVESLPEALRGEGDRLLELAAVELMHHSTADREQAAETQGKAVIFPDPVPWSYPVDGAELLSTIADTYKRFVSL